MGHFFSHRDKDRHNSREMSAQPMKQAAASVSQGDKETQARAKRTIPTMKTMAAKNMG